MHVNSWDDAFPVPFLIIIEVHVLPLNDNDGDGDDDSASSRDDHGTNFVKICTSTSARLDIAEYRRLQQTIGHLEKITTITAANKYIHRSGIVKFA